MGVDVSFHIEVRRHTDSLRDIIKRKGSDPFALIKNDPPI